MEESKVELYDKDFVEAIKALSVEQKDYYQRVGEYDGESDERPEKPKLCS